MKKILLIAVLFSVLHSPFSTLHAQMFVGTMKVGDQTFKDVTVKLTVDDSANYANIMIYHVLSHVVKPYRIDLQIPDILFTRTQQRTSFVCYNIVPLSDNEPVPEYRVGKLSGTHTAGVFSFSCTMGERRVTFSGVVNERAPYARVSH